MAEKQFKKGSTSLVFRTNRNQNGPEIPPYTHLNGEDPTLKRLLVRMWSKGNTPPLLVGMQTCTTTLEKKMFSQKIGNSST